MIVPAAGDGDARNRNCEGGQIAERRCMKPAKTSNSRRAFLKTTALGLGVIGAGASSLARSSTEVARSGGSAPVSKSPSTEIAVWYTNAKQRFAAGKAIQWQPAVVPAP